MVEFGGLRDYELSCLRFIQVNDGLPPYHLGVETKAKLRYKVIQGYGGMDIGTVASGYVKALREIRFKTVSRVLRGNAATYRQPMGRGFFFNYNSSKRR